MKITWQMARGLPVFIKGGAPVYAAGCTYPWRETEQAWVWEAAHGDWFPVEPSLALGRAYTAAAWRYDFATDRWAPLADFPCTAAGWCAIPYQNQIILLGGALRFQAQGAATITHTFHTLESGSIRQRLIGA